MTDKCNLLYIILVIHGIVILIAFNMFITAKDYFVEYKLKNTTYADNYLAYMGIVMHLPNLSFSWLNIFRGIGGDRIVWCLSFEVLIFLFTVVLAMLDSSHWHNAFFWVTMASVFVVGVCNALFLYSVFAMSSNLSDRYSGAAKLGANVCGILVALTHWLTDKASGSHRTSTIYHFIIGLVVLLGCLDLFLVLPINRFYRDSIELSNTRKEEINDDENAEAIPKSPSFRTIFKEGWVQNYSLWFICFVSFSVFPAVHSDIHSISGLFGSDFTKITCFLTYNVTAFIGSITANLWNFPRERWLWAFALVRVWFTPFFLFCNYQPRHQGELMKRTLPVLVRHDAIYWCAAVLLGWSAGHGCTLGMMYVSGGVVQRATTAGKIGSAMVVTGIVCGLCFSLLAPTVVTLSAWKHVHLRLYINGGPSFP